MRSSIRWWYSLIKVFQQQLHKLLGVLDGLNITTFNISDFGDIGLVPSGIFQVKNGIYLNIYYFKVYF